MAWGGRTVQPEKMNHKTEANARVQRAFHSADAAVGAWTNSKVLFALFGGGTRTEAYCAKRKPKSHHSRGLRRRVK